MNDGIEKTKRNICLIHYRPSFIKAFQVVSGTEPVTNAEEVKKFVRDYGLPIILKAAFGGGGRGMRKIEREEEIEDAFKRAFSVG